MAVMLAGLRSSFSQPIRDGDFIKVTSGKLEDHSNSLFGSIDNLNAVQSKKQPCENPSGPLVAICEGMIARYAIGIGSSELAQVCLAIGPLIARAGQCRFQPIHIAHANGAAMLSQLPIMDGKRQLSLDPDRFG